MTFRQIQQEASGMCCKRLFNLPIGAMDTNNKKSSWFGLKNAMYIEVQRLALTPRYDLRIPAYR